LPFGPVVYSATIRVRFRAVEVLTP
jgi:hypothetical protein